MGAVFYDENASGTQDPSENTRVPGVVVEVGGKSSAPSSKVLGEVTIAGVPGGSQALTVRRGSLPPYYVPPAGLSISVPPSQPVMIPLTLPIGTNRPNVYMAFGDSITGAGTDALGYRGRLQDKLVGYFGRGTVIGEGVDSTKSNEGADRIDLSLQRVHPAYTVILYGTNDWNAKECKNAPPCYTIDSLRDIVLSVRGAQSLPVLSTIIPGDPTSTDQPARNAWVAAQNVRIRALARDLAVPLADPEALFLKDPDFAHLYVDHVHPSDAGYELIAAAFFTAITAPADSSATSALGRLLARP